MDTRNLDRIRATGRRLRWAVRGLLGATVLSAGGVLLARGPLGLVRVPASVSLTPELLSPVGAVSVAVLGLLVPACYLFALLAMDRLFALFARGEVFGAEPTAAVRRVGYALLAVDPVRMLVSLLSGPLLTHLGATEPFISVELELSMVVAGLFVVAVGAVLGLGRELDESDRLTI